MKRYYFTFFLLILNFLSFPQSAIRKFAHFDETNGLVQAVVSATQDKQGFLWFGTEGNNGVFRYDGVEFVQFIHDPDDPNSIVSGSIYSSLCDSNGDLWFGSEGGGLSRYNPESGEFTNFYHDPENKNSIGDNQIYSLLEDSRGNLWISTIKSLDRYSLKTGLFTHFKPESGNPDSIILPMSYHMFESKDGTIWIGTHGKGLSVFNPDTEKFKSFKHNPNDQESIAHDTTGGIVEDEEGNIWIGGKGGLNKFNRTTEKFKRFTHSDSDENSLLDNFVWDIVLDNNDLWLGGFGGGLAKFNLTSEKVTRLPHNPLSQESISSNLIFFVFIDKSNVLWLGTVDGGLNKHNFSSDQFSHYKHVPGEPESFTAESIFTVYESSDETIWLGYQGHNNGLTRWDKNIGEIENILPDPGTLESGEVLYIYEDSNKRIYIGQYILSEYNKDSKTYTKIFPDESTEQLMDGKTIRTMIEDKAGNLWVGTEAALIKMSPDRKSYEIIIREVSIRSLMLDSSGNLWAGTGAEGVKKLNPETNEIIEFNNDKENGNTLSKGEILSIHQDRSGRIWLGSVGGGLNLLNPDGKSFTHYTAKDGFASNSIFSIEEDNYGNLWMGTSWGLIRFNPESKEVRNFTEHDGLQGNEFSIRSQGSARDSNGNLYFVGKKGVTVFNPADIKLNSKIPPVILTSIKLFNKKYDNKTTPEFIKDLNLSWKDNMITFNFAALDYNNPEDNNYRYMLEGFDKEWIDTGNFNQATYTNLDGGNYTFRVQAANNHGFWNRDGISLNLHVTPPWWKTWWAYLFYIVIIASLIYLKISQTEKKKKLLEKQVKLRTLELNDSLQELKETQGKLIESGKMAALGSLVAGVAHEINTPLGIGITGISHLYDSTRYVVEKINSNSLTKTSLEEYMDTSLKSSEIVLNNMMRAAELVQNFKEIAVDQSSDHKRDFMLIDYINNIISNLGPKLKTGKYQVVVNSDEDYEVTTYPGAISQILSNLIMNSLIHGFGKSKKGNIRIDIRKLGDKINLEYRDDGSGIQSDIIPRIFDPFFTTRRNFGGSGLGMHIVYNLVSHKLEGNIQCIDTNMKGSHFNIEFPQMLEYSEISNYDI